MILLSTIMTVLTKLFDLLTTLHRIEHAGQERNAMVRRWMHRWGVKKALWMSYAMVVVMATVGYWIAAHHFKEPISRIAYVIAATIISITNLAVAHTNYTGRLNAFTRWLSRRRHYR